MSSTALLNKLSWNGLIILFDIEIEDKVGGTVYEQGRQSFRDWDDLMIKNWGRPPSSEYPDLNEILEALYSHSLGEHPFAVFDFSGNLIWERLPGEFALRGLPIPRPY